MRTSGVYRIENVITGDTYIGSSVNLSNRWSVHKYELRKSTHGNGRLQAAWDKYGESSFSFSILEVVDDKNLLLATEQDFINQFNPTYNIAPNAGSSLGILRTDSQKSRISERMRGSGNPWFGKIPPCVKKRTEAQMAHLSSLHAGINNPMYGVTPPHAKLTDDQVREIRILISDGESLSKIAFRYNVSKSNIANIKKGRSYKGVA